MAASTPPAASAPQKTTEPAATTAATPAPAAEEITTIVQPSLEIDDHAGADGDDGDSAIGSSSSGGSYSTSLTEGVFDYRFENGRTYHRYKDGQYAFPNDEVEQDRLDLQHDLYKLLMDGKLCYAPVRADCQRVLDIGTGTGIWANDFADEHPAATVTGTDLSPIQSPFVAPNVHFIIDDANDEWAFSEQFDLIHARHLHCSVEEKKLFRQAYEHLVPGGWIEMKEADLPLRSDDGTLDPKCALMEYCECVVRASTAMGQAMNKTPNYARWMQEAGFVDVHEVVFKVPVNPWPKEEKQKIVALWGMEDALQSLPLATALFTRALGWSAEEVELLLVEARKNVKDQSMHTYWPLYVVYGRKPEAA